MAIRPKLPENVEMISECSLWVGLSRNDAPVSIVVPPDKNEIERVARLLSEFHYDLAKQAYPVYDHNNKVVGCLT